MSIIYGVNPVLEALKAGVQIKVINMAQGRQEDLKEIIKMAQAHNVAVHFHPNEYFVHLPKGHQSITAEIAKKKKYLVEELINLSALQSEQAFFIILDCIEDPHNFGAILRVADAAGVDGVVFQSYRSSGLNPTVAKSSAGAISHVNLAEVVNIKHAIAKMQAVGISIIGAESNSQVSLWDVDFTKGFALVVGSEGRGLRKTVKEMCNHIISIPQMGKVGSLNVSVATGIIAYEALRQRHLAVT